MIVLEHDDAATFEAENWARMRMGGIDYFGPEEALMHQPMAGEILQIQDSGVAKRICGVRNTLTSISGERENKAATC